MKRKVLFVMLCVGIVYFFAIAASIPEPIRILSNTEKAIISAGACHYCEKCSDGSDCISDWYCKGQSNGYACGGDFDYLIDECIEGSGPLGGPCDPPYEYNCVVGQYCFCRSEACGAEGEVKYISWEFSASPC